MCDIPPLNNRMDNKGFSIQTQVDKFIDKLAISVYFSKFFLEERMNKRTLDKFVWVFDMDGTLYSPVERVWDATVKGMLEHFRDDLGLPVDLSQEEQDRLRKKWNTRQTTVAYLNEFKLDFDQIIATTHLPILDSIAIKVRAGAESIQHLPGKKIVLTNSPESFAHALLKKLGIHHFFDEVLGLRHDLCLAKPNPDSYKRVTEGEQTIMIEDWEENLLVPRNMGWKTIWFPEQDQSHRPMMPAHVHMHITSLAELQQLV